LSRRLPLSLLRLPLPLSLLRLGRYSRRLLAHSGRWVALGALDAGALVADFQFWGSQGLAFDLPARLKLLRLTRRSAALPPCPDTQARFLYGWFICLSPHAPLQQRLSISG